MSCPINFITVMYNKCLVFAHIFTLNLFFKWNELVFSQGEMVDHIEENIKSSHNYVEKAVKETDDAVKTSKKVHKVSQWFILLFIYWHDNIKSLASDHIGFFFFTEKDRDCSMRCYFNSNNNYYPGCPVQLRWVPSKLVCPLCKIQTLFKLFRWKVSVIAKCLKPLFLLFIFVRFKSFPFFSYSVFLY